MKAVEVSAENLIVEVGNQQTTKPSTMSKDTEKAVVGLLGASLGLDELVRQGARQVIHQAIEAELVELLERFANVKTMHGKRAVVRNGYLPEREVLTAAGPIPVKVPKVRDRSGSGVKFNSSIVPPYVRKSPRVSAALPWLYLKGISTGDMGEALSVLLGEDAKGLSANVVSRLKAQWAEEHAAWSRRHLSKSRYVYWWVDGIHTLLTAKPENWLALPSSHHAQPAWLHGFIVCGLAFRCYVGRLLDPKMRKVCLVRASPKKYAAMLPADKLGDFCAAFDVLSAATPRGKLAGGP